MNPDKQSLVEDARELGWSRRLPLTRSRTYHEGIPYDGNFREGQSVPPAPFFGVRGPGAEGSASPPDMKKTETKQQDEIAGKEQKELTPQQLVTQYTQWGLGRGVDITKQTPWMEKNAVPSALCTPRRSHRDGRGQAAKILQRGCQQ